MKKTFIWLLIIAAAGAGTFYFLQNKKNRIVATIDKKLLTGQWKLDSITSGGHEHFALTSSDPAKYSCDFRQDGKIIALASDTAKPDTSFYEWKGKNILLVKSATKDSTGENYSVNTLSKDSLVLLSKDSVLLFFVKAK